MSQNQPENVNILSRIDAENAEDIGFEEPYGVIKDTTYTGECYLVEWPDADT